MQHNILNSAEENARQLSQREGERERERREKEREREREGERLRYDLF